jgi:hypothetical protein
MSIENTMVSGYSVPPEQEDRPDYTCARCRVGMYNDDDAFLWDKDWICTECFVDVLDNMSIVDLAEMAEMSIADAADFIDGSDVEDVADALGIERAKVEDIA